MYSVKVLSVLILIGVVQAYEKYKIVETDSGPIRGVRNTTLLNGSIFYSFRAIPYAKAPIGDLRFKAPEPVEPWKPKILDALEYGFKCPEPFVFFCYDYPMDEDCLFVNIFVPADVKPDEKMAVIFMIHGGSYRAGSGDDFFFGPDFIVEKQTILVTFNYRLGILGFLSLNSTEFSGNMGLKDQQLALKWIHSNIHHFGGDNQRITIIGQSAGAACVNFHILSPETRKYFHNAIVMSGSSQNLWAMSFEENHLKLAHKMAKSLDKATNSTDELITFLKEVPIEDIQWFIISAVDNDVFVTRLAPVIESPDAKQPFLIESPQKLLESSKIDVDAMFTVTKMEQLADEIREFYFGNVTITEDSIMTYLEMMSDINMFLNIDQSVKQLAAISKGKIYYMQFAVDSKLNAMKQGLLFDHMKDTPGTSHGDDLCYLFRCGKIADTYDAILRNTTDKDSKIALQSIEYITKLFTNFAKYGEPTYQKDPIDEFLPVESEHTHYLNIDNDGLSPEINLRQKYVDFWSGIKRKALELSNDERQNEIDAE